MRWWLIGGKQDLFEGSCYFFEQWKGSLDWVWSVREMHLCFVPMSMDLNSHKIYEDNVYVYWRWHQHNFFSSMIPIDHLYSYLHILHVDVDCDIACVLQEWYMLVQWKCASFSYWVLYVIYYYYYYAWSYYY